MLQSLFIRYQKQTTICWSRSLNALENLSHMCHARLIHYKFLTTYRRCWSSAPVCRGGHSARTEPACDSCSSLAGSSGSRPLVRPTSGSPRRNCPSLSASGQAPVLYTVANHYDDLLVNSYTSTQWEYDCCCKVIICMLTQCNSIKDQQDQFHVPQHSIDPNGLLYIPFGWLVPTF